MGQSETFDPVWEEKYAGGHRQRYPWDQVVSFVFRCAPRDRERNEVNILEVGCGSGANLWFAAQEGFAVTGLDASESAIKVARSWFREEKLEGDFMTGDFTALPCEDESFDLVIDRAAITCCGSEGGKRAIAEVARVLRPGGKFLFNPYSAAHASADSGLSGPDGTRIEIDRGTLVGFGQLYFYDAASIREAFSGPWKLHAMNHLQTIDELSEEKFCHAEWRIIAEKIAN